MNIPCSSTAEQVKIIFYATLIYIHISIQQTRICIHTFYNVALTHVEKKQSFKRALYI